MTMVNDLFEIIDDIENDGNEWAATFITNMKIQKEEKPTMKYTGPQFKKLVELHNKYCAGGRKYNVHR